MRALTSLHVRVGLTGLAVILPTLLQASPGHAQAAPVPSTQAPKTAPVSPDEAAAPEEAPSEAPTQQGQAEPAEAHAPALEAAPEADSSPQRAPSPAFPASPPPPASDPVLELSTLDAELARLQEARSRAGIVGPVALTAAGFSTAIGFSALAVASFAIAENIADGAWDHDYDLNDDGDVDEQDEDDARRMARISAGVASAGLAAGIGGTVWLARRLSQRNRYNPDIRSLKEQRRQLLYQLRYGANLDSGGAGLQVSGRF
jgi:hypothetical protein